MNKKIILPIVLVVLIGMSSFVYAQRVAEIEVTINQGWNLLYGFARPDQLDGQFLDKSHIKAIYAFIPTIQQYAIVYPDLDDKIYLMDDDELIQTAFWVFSDKTETTEYWLDDLPVPINERPMYKGWNFVGITPDMINIDLKNLQGSCDIEKIYWFDSSIQNWVQLSLKDNFGANMMGIGVVIKVSDNCKLGDLDDQGSITSPPKIPSGSKTSCTDLDGGKNYNTKGTVDYFEDNMASTFTDKCTYQSLDPDSKTLDEGYCLGDQFKFDRYECPNSCSNGRCI